MKTKSGVFNKKTAFVKFLWPYDVFYSEMLFLFLFLQYERFAQGQAS